MGVWSTSLRESQQGSISECILDHLHATVLNEVGFIILWMRPSVLGKGVLVQNTDAIIKGLNLSIGLIDGSLKA